MINIKRGDIVLVNLDPVIGSEQGKTRPVLIIQNDVGNEFSPTIIIASITSNVYDKEYPTNVFLSAKISKLDKDSTILLNQIRTIDKKRIIKKLGSINQELIKKVDKALIKSLSIEM
jgi:mRNA interferase MazF